MQNGHPGHGPVTACALHPTGLPFFLGARLLQPPPSPKHVSVGAKPVFRRYNRFSGLPRRPATVTPPQPDACERRHQNSISANEVRLRSSTPPSTVPILTVVRRAKVLALVRFPKSRIRPTDASPSSRRAPHGLKTSANAS